MSMTQRSPWTDQLVNVMRLREDVEIPEYQTEGAAGFDLALAEDLHLSAAEIKLAPTGLVFATPSHHMMYITFRSSTPIRWGVTVLEGILDEDYCGNKDECMLQVMNLEHISKVIPKGTRLAQGIFTPITRGIFVDVSTMSAESRGGYGSTGTGLEPRPVRKNL